MKLLPEDPRLTAYALGEIEDTTEHAEIDAAVAASPELQAVVASVREMGDLLGAEFAAEPAPELTEFEKAKMEPALTVPTMKKRFGGEVLLYWPVALGAALAGVAAVAVALVMFPQKQVEVSHYSYDVERSEESPTLNIDASMGAVEDLEIRVEQQQQRVDALRAKMDSFDVAVREDSGSSVTVSEPPVLMSREDFMKQSPSKTLASEVPSSDEGRFSFKPQQQDSSHVVALKSAPAMPTPRPEPIIISSPDISIPALNIDVNVSNSSSYGPGSGGGGLPGNVKVAEFEGFIDYGDAQADSSKPSKDQSLAVDQVEVDWLFDFDAAGALVPNSQLAQKTDLGTENYDVIEETDFRSPLVAPLSTFSIDVDTASYANVRRFLNQGQLPPADAVRIEELINYFPYADAAPTESLDEGGAPFAVHMDQTIAPWNASHRLLRVALKGYEMPWDERPASNLVFLLDVSGSMNNAKKLPLVKEAMDLLINRLDARDRVAIVVYAGASGLVLPSTTANNRETIAHALNNLKAGGSTNAGAGIELAYKTARQHFIEGGNNRVILCTDGDFNVGQTNRGALAETAEAEADEGISLTILGFGMGNLKDGMLETLSNKGKGTYAYVDSSAEARKVFLEDLASNIFKIAKDVKIQVEFNPSQVKAYRLIGYENRRLKSEDFNNDAKRAGDIGPGHSVVALYEIVPADVAGDLPGVDALRYQQAAEQEPVPGEVATVKLRYKQPNADVSQLITRTVQSDAVTAFNAANVDVRFSAAVAAFGLRLSGSETVQGIPYRQIESIAAGALGVDSGGHRSEFVGLVRQARQLSSDANSGPSSVD